MAESHIVTGLVAKHSELAGLIKYHRNEIERVTQDLKHLDATLKIFSPDIDLRTLTPKRICKGNLGGFKHFKSHECNKLALDVLRKAVTPLDTTAIAEQIVAVKGLDDTKDMRVSVQRTLTTTLRQLEKRGIVKNTGKDGLLKLWEIA